MKKFLSILFFLCLFPASLLFSEEIEIDSEVMSTDPELEFFIIRAGESSGIEIGDSLIVHRAGEKIAEAYIIEVRPEVSAAEILHIEGYKAVREGDEVLIVKKTGSKRKTVKRKTAKKSKWTNILGPGRGMDMEPAVDIISEKKDTYISGSGIGEREVPVSINIKGGPDRVFAYARMVLKENGYSITSSDRATGTLLAAKPIQLSLISELWADSLAAIDHNIVVSFDIKPDGDSSKLSAFSFKEHFQKGKYIKHGVDKYSKYYNELVALVSEIKERSEY